MGKKIEKRCACCGGKIVEYRHVLSKSLIRSMYRFAQLGQGAQLVRKANMTISQRTNFQKLQYWGLIEKDPDEEAKGGSWVITPAGWSFLRGNHRVCKYVWTFRGKWVRGEGDVVGVDDLTGGWKYRPDYAKEAKPHPV